MLSLSINPRSLDCLKCLAVLNFTKTPKIKVIEEEKRTRPCLTDGSKLNLTDPSAIGLFLSTPNFCHSDNLKMGSQVRQWLDFSLSEMKPFLTGDAERSNPRSSSYLLGNLRGLNSHLSSRTFLVGEGLSLADVFVALDVAMVQDKHVQAFGHVKRWHKTVMNQEQMLATTKVAAITNDEASKSKLSASPKKANNRRKGKEEAKKTEKPLNILCLHGYRQNASTFKLKLGAFRKLIKKRADFTFVTAPHVVPSKGEEGSGDEPLVFHSIGLGAPGFEHLTSLLEPKYYALPDETGHI